MVHPIDDSGCFTKEAPELVKRCKATLLKCAAKVVSLVQVPDFMGQHVKAADKDIKVAAND